MAQPGPDTTAPRGPKLADIDLTDPRSSVATASLTTVFTDAAPRGARVVAAVPARFRRGAADDGFWVLSKYEDIQAANRDTPSCSRRSTAPRWPTIPEMRGTMLVSMDGKAHTRQRKLISAGFTPRMISRLEERARHWAVEIVESALERGHLRLRDRTSPTSSRCT